MNMLWDVSVCVCSHWCQRKRRGQEQRERQCSEQSIINSDRQERGSWWGGIAASSAVMLTDTVPGGAVTQRDSPRHKCPISSSQCISHARIHQRTHRREVSLKRCVSTEWNALQIILWWARWNAGLLWMKAFLRASQRSVQCDGAHQRALQCHARW